MNRQWASIIIFSVILVVVWSGWEIYTAFREDIEVTTYSKYVEPINTEIDEPLLIRIEEAQQRVFVKQQEIEPKN